MSLQADVDVHTRESHMTLNECLMSLLDPTSLSSTSTSTNVHKLIHMQARSKPILIGQAILHMSSRGSGGMHPRKFVKTAHRKMQSGAFWRMFVYFKIHNHKFCTIYLKVPKICSLCSEFPTNSFAIFCSLSESVMSLCT